MVLKARVAGTGERKKHHTHTMLKNMDIDVKYTIDTASTFHIKTPLVHSTLKHKPALPKWRPESCFEMCFAHQHSQVAVQNASRAQNKGLKVQARVCKSVWCPQA